MRDDGDSLQRKFEVRAKAGSHIFGVTDESVYTLVELGIDGTRTFSAIVRKHVVNRVQNGDADLACGLDDLEVQAEAVIEERKLLQMDEVWAGVATKAEGEEKTLHVRRGFREPNSWPYGLRRCGDETSEAEWAGVWGQPFVLKIGGLSKRLT